MRTDEARSFFLLGLLVGVGAGLVAYCAFELGRRAQERPVLSGRRRFGVGQKLKLSESGSPQARERRAERAQRELNARIDRLRTAGF